MVPLSPALLAALGRLEPAFTAFASSLADDVRLAVPTLARLPRVAVYDLVLTLQLAAVEGARRGIGPTTAQLLATERHVAQRAELGIPVADVLAGIQLSKQRFIDVVLAELGTAASAGEVVAFVRFADDWVEQLRRHVLLVHQETELQLARGGAVLRRLLQTGEAGELAEHGMDPSGPLFLCRLRPSVGEAAWAAEASLTGALERAVTGWVDGTVAAVSATPLNAALVDRRVATAGPLRARELPQAHALLLTALDLSPAHGLVRLEDVGVAVGQAEQPLLGLLLGRALLRGLDRTVADHVALVTTVLAYLSCGARLDRTAADLHVHVNTVKHRLRRFRDLTGSSVQDHPAELAWAARTWLGN